MTDDLVARLRAVDHMSVEDCFLQSPLFGAAADRLEAAEARVRELEAQLAEAYERAAKEAETCWVTYTGRAGDDEREQIGRARLDIAAAIRKLAQEVKHEAE